MERRQSSARLGDARKGCSLLFLLLLLLWVQLWGFLLLFVLFRFLL